MFASVIDSLLAVLVARRIIRGNVREEATLLFGCARDYTHTVDLLLEKGVNVNCHDATMFAGYDRSSSRRGRSPLQFACARGNAGLVKRLLELGADVNWKDTSGHSTMWYAVFPGCVETLRLLIESGADVNSADGPDSIPALSSAAQMGFVEIVALLLEKGANPNAQHGDGSTALHGAIVGSDAGYAVAKTRWGAAPRPDHTECARLLIEAGADPNTFGGGGGLAPLHAAAVCGSAPIAQLLLASGADPSIRHARGLGTALDAAMESGHNEVAQVLRDAAQASASRDRQSRWQIGPANAQHQDADT